MRKILGLLLVFGCCLSAAQAGKIVLQGKAANYKEDSLVITYEPYQVLAKTVKLTVPIKDGAFSFIVDSDVPLRVFMDFGKIPVVNTYTIPFPGVGDSTLTSSGFEFRLVFLFLQPGDNMKMNVDCNDIKNSLRFTGNAADNNMFVNKEEWVLNSYREKVLRNFHEPVYFLPEDFTQSANKRLEYKLHFLDSITKIYKISPALKDIYYWKFYGEWATARINYPKTHEMYTSEKAQLPPGYFDFVKDVKTAEKGADKGLGYFYFLNGLMNKRYELYGDSTVSFETFVKKTMQGKALYEYMAFRLGSKFSQEAMAMFEKDSPYPDLAALVQARFKNMKEMLPGSPAPDIKLLSPDGKAFSFASFKGKYIYIDFWATWCGPCIKEIPSLIELEKEYHGKDIAFVSISFDKDADVPKWKNFIKKNTMGNIQLWANTEGNKRLTKSWNISSIPRFVILDREGKVVDSNAPFPSSREIRPLLNKLF